MSATLRIEELTENKYLFTNKINVININNR